ncbi:M28 family peptidase [Catellatospora aurea]|uniref:M28 family peptidase n=1 Tax=Catellatospora aurea TaxID=1337874 RepID=A0ABW2HA30_9ACTN
MYYAGEPSRKSEANKLRFFFWGAEEWNLRGSRYHVANLSDDEAAKIKMYPT